MAGVLLDVYINYEIMPTNRGTSRDRKLVAGGQEHEVKYEARKTGASTKQVKAAVKTVGNDRKKVEQKLSSTRKSK